jgi:death-on-curing protein
VNVEWIAYETLLIFHDAQISEHGGAPGLREEGGLRSALARPENLAAYGDPDLFELAAAYAGGIARNHPFVDGNKRTAFVVSVAFLDLNGQELKASEAEAAVVFLRLAAGEFSEAELAEWFRRNASPPDTEFLSPEQDQ